MISIQDKGVGLSTRVFFLDLGVAELPISLALAGGEHLQRAPPAPHPSGNARLKKVWQLV